MINVLYDHQIFTWQKFGGISRYFYELFRNAEGLYNYTTSGVFSDNEYIKELSIMRQFPIDRTFKGKSRIIECINRRNSINKLRKSTYDVFHPTYYNPYFIDYMKNKKFVVTVYDMIHEIYRNDLKDDMTISYKKELINEASAIIAISESTKNDILNFFPNIDPQKIHITYLGNSFPISEISVKEKNYILFTGQRYDYKNFKNFVIAVAPLLKKYQLKLIFTGRKFTIEEISFFHNLDILEYVDQRYVNDEELRILYNEALLFVFPSKYEGFGIPILEAFASKCPLVLSNTSSFPEIAKDGGYYFNPNNIDEIQEKIEDVICSENLRNELIMRGTNRLKDFSWEKCAKQTFEIYKLLTE